MPVRLAPALGLAASCLALVAVGVLAMVNADGGRRPAGYARALPVPVLTSPVATKPRSHRSGAGASASRGDSQAAGSSQPTAASQLTGAGRPVPGAVPATSASTQPAQLDFAQAVFRAVNEARTAHQLTALTWSDRLRDSAAAHNRRMAEANTLSHQVGDEPSLGGRESRAGLRWSFAAENIGWTTDRTLTGVLDIMSRMLAEQPPNDAHRRNILSPQAETIGIDVYYDASHDRLWLTEDFAGS